MTQDLHAPVTLEASDFKKAVEAIGIIHQLSFQLKGINPLFALALALAGSDLLDLVDKLVAGAKAAQAIQKAAQK